MVKNDKKAQSPEALIAVNIQITARSGWRRRPQCRGARSAGGP